MHHRDLSFVRSLVLSVAVGLILALSVVVDARAARPDFAASAQPAAAPLEPNAKRAHLDPDEARIRELHDKLQITESQAGQWEAVARTMRSNAKTIAALVQEKRKDKMTAVEDLRAYQEIAAAHAKAAGKLADAFEVLYGTMSEDQRRLADSVFHQSRRDVAGFR
ncbi:Spy/CpxP family protein refolding chaperone [Telmatospirillum sp.]|uniref:Spy/CpxP family protein refolding chaperone n=1 Tax=Telmatospirillum sp. TaxID=2079197 RepID=UPI002841450C|nr:Spy/CpxP family protein refolding chaperone [Telmatospirillum sp.]MDR3439695.1 Spy/CpxP family protein refolding chaperone [Telmatospirillum sp.]